MSKRFTVLTALFCVCLIASNIFETKIFPAGPLTLTGGFLIFPVSYIINDCLSEVYGYSRTRFVIVLSLVLNLCFVGMAQVVRILPEVEYAHIQESFDSIFSADQRITVASILAFFVGSLLNSKVMVGMRERKREGEKGDEVVRGFGARAIVSSLVGESVDSLVFFPIAFWGVGVSNMLTLMVTQIALKTLYEVLILPFTSLFVRHLKKVEGPWIGTLSENS